MVGSFDRIVLVPFAGQLWCQREDPNESKYLIRYGFHKSYEKITSYFKEKMV